MSRGTKSSDGRLRFAAQPPRRATRTAFTRTWWGQTKELIRTAWGHDEQPVLRAARNRCTVLGRYVQLRYGRDGYWYPYRKEDGRWWPAGTTGADPVSVLSGLLAP